jgi:serine/threonine protein kinase
MNTASKEVIRLSAAAVSGAAASHPSGRAIQSTTEASVVGSSQVQAVRAIGSGPHLSRSGPHAVKSRCGMTLRRRYRLDAQMTKSALGEHFQGFDLVRRKPCLIKLARVDAGLSLLADTRLRNEARILARLSHPNIIEACEFNQDESAMSFLVLESVEGISLKQHLENKGRLPLSEAMEILRGICLGLGRAHEVGIVHGNLHPGSILLCKPRSASGSSQVVQSIAESVKLTHFELACELGVCTDDQDTIPPYVLMGTLPYRAPEALVGDMRGLSPRSDIWSIAVVMYQVLSGRLPFAEEDTRKLSEEISFADPISLSQLVTDLPHCVSDAIMTALSKSRCLRFATAGEFLRAMEGKTTQAEADTQQKGGPTGLFQVTPLLLAECRAQSPSTEAVPMQVAVEQSTRRYPREDYPHALIDELQVEERKEEKKAETARPSSEAMDEESSGGRLLILSIALLTILLGSAFAMGFVIVKRVHHAVALSEQSSCAGESLSLDEHAISVQLKTDPNTALAEQVSLAGLVADPLGPRALSPVFVETQAASEPSWVPVAPAPVFPPTERAKQNILPSASPSPAPVSAPVSAPVPARAQTASRHERKEPIVEDPDLDALPPPADAPPFAGEHSALPLVVSAPDSQAKDQADATP